MSNVVLVCGLPASGKTSRIKFWEGYDRLNRDTVGGKVADLLPKLEALLVAGKNVILDNLFIKSEDRKPFIQLAKSHKATVYADQMATSIEDCQVNACIRMCRKYGKVLNAQQIKDEKDPNTFPPAVLFKANKEFQPCTQSEGFDAVNIIKFKRTIQPDYVNKAIILDYDGTLRQTVGGNGKFPTKLSEQKILVERADIVKSYKDKGYIICGASNQSGIAKGDLTHAAARECFDEVGKVFGIDIDYLYDDSRVPPITSWSRKPMPGMGVHFIEKYLLDPAKCIMVGDMTSDKTFATRCGFEFIHADVFFK